MKNGTEVVAKEMEQLEWEQMLKETGMDKLQLTLDVLSLMRVSHSLGFNRGQTVMFEVIKDIYDHDIDQFEGFFETDETLLH